MDGGGGGGLDLSKLSAGEREEIMRNVQTQVAMANMQEILSKVSDKCFKKCISSPGSSLSNSDQKCLSMCMDRYLDSFNLVSRAYTERLRRESNAM